MFKKKTTYRALITAEMEKHKETWADVVACTMPERRLNKLRRLHGYYEEDVPFTLWTKNRVYFQEICDERGFVFIASVPRNPCKETTSIIS